MCLHWIEQSTSNDSGTVIGFIDIVKAQFYWYSTASYGIDTIFKFVDFSKTLSFFLVPIVGCWLIALKFQKKEKEFEELAVAFSGFILMLAMVVGRYMLLRNHSDIHVFFVDRYLFVYAGTVYFFLFWIILSTRQFLPKHSSIG